MKNASIPKIAIFYDWLNQWGGAERLLLDLLKLFPDSQLFTSVYQPEKTKWLKNKKVNTSILNKYDVFKSNSIISALAQPIALEQFDFHEFDIVISLTSLQGKCLLTAPHTLFICYCLTPNRYLYEKKYSFLKQLLINTYKKIDYLYSQRPDYYLAISKTVNQRLQKNYHRNSTIIYPGVDTTLFKPSQTQSDYFLVVSRLVPHKKVELAINACIQTNNKLYIIGSGRHLSKLQKTAKQNPLITFIDTCNQTQLINYYQNCRALICPQNEDFGFVAIEAMACGRPIIAFGKGGFEETVIDGQTGVLFNKQCTSSLVDAIKRFQETSFSPVSCRQRAIKFSRNHFMLDFKQNLQRLWHQYRQTITIS